MLTERRSPAPSVAHTIDSWTPVRAGGRSEGWLLTTRAETRRDSPGAAAYDVVSRGVPLVTRLTVTGATSRTVSAAALGVPASVPVADVAGVDVAGVADVATAGAVPGLLGSALPASTTRGSTTMALAASTASVSRTTAAATCRRGTRRAWSSCMRAVRVPSGDRRPAAAS
jgi:hypothetical protein